jgi:hypothetical protein
MLAFAMKRDGSRRHLFLCVKIPSRDAEVGRLFALHLTVGILGQDDSISHIDSVANSEYVIGNKPSSTYWVHNEFTSYLTPRRERTTWTTHAYNPNPRYQHTSITLTR